MPGRHPAVVLWTGGKDSCLALHEAGALGYSIRSLVTFGPSAAAFRAHPIPFLQKQAEAMGLLHRTIEVMPPLEQGYQRAFRYIRDELGASHVITGDIDEVGTHPNWVKTIAGSLGLNVLMPLWKRENTIRSYSTARCSAGRCTSTSPPFGPKREVPFSIFRRCRSGKKIRTAFR